MISAMCGISLKLAGHKPGSNPDQQLR